MSRSSGANGGQSGDAHDITRVGIVTARRGDQSTVTNCTDSWPAFAFLLVVLYGMSES